jgi:hypothetical protein
MATRPAEADGAVFPDGNNGIIEQLEGTERRMYPSAHGILS